MPKHLRKPTLRATVEAELRAAGVPCFVSQRRTDHAFHLEIDAPDDGTLSASEWQHYIEDRFEARVIESVETVADWRPNKPVIFVDLVLATAPIRKPTAISP